MFKLQHSIRKQTLELEVASEAMALALQPRLSDINRQYFLPVMERVFDEFGVEGWQTRIDKLHVDLGELPFDRFEEVAAERFYYELRRVLEETLRKQDETQTPGNGSHTEEASRLELFEHYLLHGTLPFWASHGAVFSFEELVSELAESNAAGLVQIIKNHGRQKRVIERLILQLSDEQLRQLLYLLEPESAALILAYMIDLREVHRVEPVVRLSNKEFARFLWILVLTYLVSERGSHFNRKSFVAWLLEGMAESEGLDYTLIVTTLNLGLRRTERNRPLETSLTAIINELTQELNLDAGVYESARVRQSRPGLGTEQPGDEAQAALDNSPHTEEASRLELFEHYLLHGTQPFPLSRTEAFSFEELMTELAESDAAGLVGIIRQHGRQRLVIERIVLQLSDEQLRRLLHLLEPEYAALILAYMVDLREVHRVEPVVRLSNKEFARFLWILVLTYLVREPGSQFNRKSFVKSLFEGMAESEGLEYVEIVAMARLGLRKTEKNHALEASLTAIIGELVYELDEAEFRKQPEAHEASVQTTEGASAIDYTYADNEAPDRASDALARLESYLNKETAGEAREEKSDMRELLRYLTAHDVARTRQLVQRLARRSEHGLSYVVDRLLYIFPTEDLLRLLAPEQKEFIAGLVEDLSSARAQIAHVGSVSRDVTSNMFWQAALASLLSEPSVRWNRRALIRQVVEAAAARIETSPVSLAEALAGVFEQTTSTHASSLAHTLETVRQDLHDQSRTQGRARPAFARYDQMEVLRYYLKHGVMPWSAICREPELTVAETFASLHGLPRSLLCALFSELNPERQLEALVRAVRMMSEDSLGLLLLRLLPQAKEVESPFRSALPAFAARAEDKHSFYARLMAAILNGRSLDLEAFASAASIEQRTVETASDVAEWDAHLLKSVIASRLRFGETSTQSERSLPVLLDALITKYPEDARHFCRALLHAHGLLRALMRQCSASDFERLLELLCAGDSQTLNALLRSIDSVPVAYRLHTKESPRQLVFQELLSLREAEPLTDIFFARVLGKLYGTPLPDEVRRLLLQEAATWAASENLPVAHATAFEAAITSDTHEKSALLRKPPAIRDAVFTLLTGEGQESHAPAESHVEAGTQLPDALSDDALRHTLTVMLEDSTEDVYLFITRCVRDARRREHLIKTLPESVLARLSYLLEPRRARILLDAAEVLASAWLETAPPDNRALTERSVLWSFLLEFMAHDMEDEHSLEHEDEHSVERMVSVFFEYMAARYLEHSSPENPGPLSVGTRLLEHAGRLATATGQAHLHAVFHSHRALLLSPWESRASAPRLPPSQPVNADRPRTATAQDKRPRQARGKTASGKTAFSMKADEDDRAALEPLYISNAGLVLTGPFLPHLFQTLDMLSEDEEGRTRLRDSETVSRAVHLLQYLVNGSRNAPEPLLVLNKILCGIPVSAPVDREVELTEKELEVCEQLLKAMIANWKIIPNTSIAGLQETFLRREGRLERVDGEWKLRVQRKTVDVLVDQIPWSVSVIFHRWMPQPLYVDW